MAVVGKRRGSQPARPLAPAASAAAAAGLPCRCTAACPPPTCPRLPRRRAPPARGSDRVL